MYTQINNKYRLYISNWLILMFFLVSSMIVVGGLTRLTDSGLSITDWEFFRGFFPPLDNETWNAYFDSYKKIPEFKFSAAQIIRSKKQQTKFDYSLLNDDKPSRTSVCFYDRLR